MSRRALPPRRHRRRARHTRARSKAPRAGTHADTDTDADVYADANAYAYAFAYADAALDVGTGVVDDDGVSTFFSAPFRVNASPSSGFAGSFNTATIVSPSA